MSDTPDSEEGQGGFSAEDAEDRTRESRPRTVVLRHDNTGSYQILMGSRVLQGFCQEFEDVTGCSMGVDLQQRVRIHIEYIGRRQQARYPEREDRPDALLTPRLPNRDPEDVANQMQRTLVDGAPLYSMAHPGNPTVTMTWQDEARQALHEQMTRMQHMLNLLESL
jgi:hypothetical protein